MSSDRDRWLQLSRLFDRAVELDAEARVAFVARCRAHDPSLGEELQRMLDADATTHGLDAGAAAATAASLHDEDEDARRAIGERLGPWRLLALLGRGGMGSVYAAQREDGETGQQAAIKRLQRRWDGSTQAQRFLQERRILALLSHANIPALIDHGLDDEGRPWLALEFVDGRPLTDWADARLLGLRERTVLFLQVCAAVQHAHERLVVHRDLKPANILVDAGGRARVLDFGVAKLLHAPDSQTRTGLFAGFTPEYAAPEQVSGGAITAATDVYALGVLLYQLLSGALPYRFEQADLRDAAEAITTRSPGRLDRAMAQGAPDDVQARMRQRSTTPVAYRRFVRGDLARIVQTALAKEPARRYASVQALTLDLQRFLDGRPVSVSGDTLGYRTRKFVRRNRWGVAMAALACLALGAGTTGTVFKAREAQAAAVRAGREATHARAQQVIAQSEAARAKASRDFLTSLLGEASPERNRGQDPTVRQVLDRASARIDRELAGQPELQVETLTTVASAYSDLSQYDAAHALLQRAVDIAARTPALDPGVRATAHARYAYVMLSRSDAAASERSARRAIEILRTRPPGAMLAEALGTLATAQYLQQAYAPALRSQRESARIVADTAGERSRAYAGSLVELSYFLEGAGQGEDAMLTAQRAVALLQALDPADSSPLMSRALWAYGNALGAAGRDAEAIEPLARAYRMVSAIYGDTSLKAMRSLQLLGAAELGAGRHAQARQHLQQAATLIATQAPTHPLATLVALGLGEAQLRGGDPASAEGTLRQALDAMHRMPTNARERSDKAQWLLARTEDALQRHDAARARLEPLLAQARRDAAPSLGAVLVAAADNARLRGDTQAAGRLLREASALVDARSHPQLRADLAQAQARLAPAMAGPVPPRRPALTTPTAGPAGLQAPMLPRRGGHGSLPAR